MLGKRPRAACSSHAFDNCTPSLWYDNKYKLFKNIKCMGSQGPHFYETDAAADHKTEGAES